MNATEWTLDTPPLAPCRFCGHEHIRISKNRCWCRQCDASAPVGVWQRINQEAVEDYLAEQRKKAKP